MKASKGLQKIKDIARIEQEADEALNPGHFITATQYSVVINAVTGGKLRVQVWRSENHGEQEKVCQMEWPREHAEKLFADWQRLCVVDAIEVRGLPN